MATATKNDDTKTEQTRVDDELTLTALRELAVEGAYAALGLADEAVKALRTWSAKAAEGIDVYADRGREVARELNAGPALRRAAEQARAVLRRGAEAVERGVQAAEQATEDAEAADTAEVDTKAEVDAKADADAKAEVKAAAKPKAKTAAKK